MPTACSPRNYASCTSMIGGRLRSVQIPAEGSDSHPFATCVCPIPVSVFHFPFFSLYGPTSFHQKSCHISPFSPAPPSVSRHTFLHFSSPLHRPFVLLHPCLSHSPYVLSFFHIIMYAHVYGCGSAASFASLQVCLPFFSFSVFVYARANIIMCVSFSSGVLRYKNMLCNTSVIQSITKKFQGIRIICLVKVCLLALKGLLLHPQSREMRHFRQCVTDLVKQT